MRRSGRYAVTMLLAALLAVPVAVIGVVFTADAAGAAITNFTDPTMSQPADIAAGPDGALWFTNFSGNSIGRITTAGAVTNFTDPTISNPVDIAAGPDGAMWFTNRTGDSIGRITTSGVVTNFTDPTIDFPLGIVAGPDGAMWFANRFNDSIGRITTGGAITNFTSPAISQPIEITTGPDGALWFTNDANSSVGRITTSGAATDFPDPSIVDPSGITTGPDGALWFANSNGHSIDRITTSGTITSFTNPGVGNPEDITTGPDGALWFADFGGSIGRITTTGVISRFTDPTISGPEGIAVGSDGALWFANLGNSIGRITTNTPGSCGNGCVSVSVSAQPGVAAASSSGPPTDANPTKQVITLPKQPGAQPVNVTLQSINPASKLSTADKLLCPSSGNKCSGQISGFGGDFSKYTNKARPIQIQIIAKWKSKVGPGKLLMSKDAGGPPVQLAKCVAKGGKFNTPCLKSEVVSGSAARHNLITTSTILFVGTDPRFARHLATGPDAPTAVKAIAGAGKATVTWTPPVVTNGKVTGYTVTPHLGKVAQKAVSFPGTVRKAVMTGLKKGKAYTFTIVTKTTLGVSLASKASNPIKPT